MVKERRATKVLNAIGTAGFVSVFFQWLWVLVLYLPTIVASPVFQMIIPKGKSSEQPTPPPETVTSVPFEVPGAVSVLILVLGVGLAGLLLFLMITKIVKSSASAGKVVTHQPAIAIGEIIAQRTPMKAKQERQLSANIIFSLKLLLLFAPLALLLPTLSMSLSTPLEVIMAIGLFLAAFSLVAFVTQFVASKLLKVSYIDIR